MTGSDFLQSVMTVSRERREEMILDAFRQGSVPPFMCNWKYVTVMKPGSAWTVVYGVLPDYLCIGTDADYVRIPMSPLTAQKVADLYQCCLPTRKMVNDIYQAAKIKLAPHPLPPGAQMMSTAYYQKHNEIIEDQLKQTGFTLGDLIDGHKKNVILSQTIKTHPNRVIIYGWHQLNGKAIQPLSWIHENTYADYSHGIRLIYKTVSANGTFMPMADALKHPDVSPLLSDEGVITATGYR
jgi:hypothetical protein